MKANGGGKVPPGTEELMAAELQLRQAQRMEGIGRLAGGVAHELGTPLAVVDGMAQRLERRGDALEEAGAIRGAVERMGRIVRELLAFGAWNSGDRQRVAIRAVLVGAAFLVGFQAAAGPDSLLATMELRDRLLRSEGSLKAREGELGAGEGGDDVPRAAWPVVSSPSWRAERRSSSQVVSRPPSTSPSVGQ